MPVKKIITSEKIPIKFWLDNIEEGALEQAKNLANLPFAFHHIAIMPDCHQGYGMPIGGILAGENTVVPNAVGVDIGCGMCACETEKSVDDIGLEALKKILGLIRKEIPLGFKHHEKKQQEKWMPEIKSDLTIVKNEYKRAQKQVGTLGGGNHFINLMKDLKTGRIWIMLHSGSRNLGKKVADYYNGIAKKINHRQNSKVPKNWDLAYLRADSNEGQRYIREMDYCVEFAFANRKHMLDKTAKIFSQVTNAKVNLDQMINIAHNYVAEEVHFDRKVWVHRKGATRAEKGESGIIPGCQGSKSYIVKGRANVESFKSCSHGAGRQMGRRQAQKTLDLKKEQVELEKRGILHSLRGKMDLDEAPGAYKDISKVMRDQSDLVTIEVELEPLAAVVAGN